MNSRGPILVAGATGAQGGAVIDALLEKGMPARALVRDPRSPAAQALAARGVELAAGSFDDESSLARAMIGAAGVFSVQVPPAPDDPESELRAGRNLIGAARKAGVGMFVHTSVARAGDQESFAGWPGGQWPAGYWNSKSGVNDMVRAAGFPHWVILKPAFMMECYIPPKVERICPMLVRGIVGTAMEKGRKLDLIAAADIGRFAAAAFADPERFHGQEIDLAAQSLDTDGIAAAIAEATGKPAVARHMTPEEAIAEGNSPHIVSSQQWANVEGYQVDLDRARAHGIALQNFAQWARLHKEDFVIDGI